MTVLVTWAVTLAISSAGKVTRQPAGVSWNVITNPGKIGGFADLPITITLPQTVRPQDGPGSGCTDFTDWGHKYGAVDTSDSRLQIVVQGQSDGQVLISQARAVVVKKEPTIRGVILECPSAGATEFRGLSVRLDSDNLDVKYDNPGQQRFGFTVAKGETETFLLTAHAQDSAFSWVLNLTVVANGRTRTIRVDDHGQPFRTTAKTDGREWTWNYRDGWSGDGQTLPIGADLSGSA